ncbi:hypothetical protein F511_21966 [Dorcoceras hygrometricum]|uniref:Bacterial Ig-like domain-containing protein n=1 Tax=Dorcoceras hygrometricum TaxID=472368 RepID=A0A2Z7C8Z5_9LAMI|nr:hypothetical protein F511_21966 [Dorcoceras hygrometricum]
MGLKLYSFLNLESWVFLALCSGICCGGSEDSVKLLKTPSPFSNSTSAAFRYQVIVRDTGSVCSNCSTVCKLDYGTFTACNSGKVSYTRLQDGLHSFEACIYPEMSILRSMWTISYEAKKYGGVLREKMELTGLGEEHKKTSYNKFSNIFDRIDSYEMNDVYTVNPTAYITATTSFTSTSHVPINISFSEPCGGEGGFRCTSIKACNLHVYGPGQVVPNTLRIMQPNLKYSITVSLAERVRFGRLILVMDKDFCTDSAGNKFTRTDNSSLFIHYDRRTVRVNMRTHVPERLLQIDEGTREVMATNKMKNLKVYLYFTQPVVNSSAEILNTINTSQGLLVPITGNNFRNRRFGYQLTDIPDIAIITVSLHSNLVISRQGTPVAPVSPITFLYDSQRPAVKLSTKCLFGQGKGAFRFKEMSRSTYIAHIQAESDVISVTIPQNVTTDVSGNKNTASEILQVRHYSVPLMSLVVSTFVNITFALTCLVAVFLTVSTSSLLSIGAFSRPSSSLSSHPTRNIFRIAYHIQVFGLSRWLAVTLPVEYYEMSRGLQWSIPYYSFPWERGNVVGSSSPMDRHGIHDSIIVESVQPIAGNPDSAAKVYGLPLTPLEYIAYFESKSNMPGVDSLLDPQNADGWRDFSRSMFWLAVIGGGLIMLHALLLFVLKFKRKDVQKWSYGALVFPRFEISLLMLSLPSFSVSSAAVIKGGTTPGIIVGVLVLGLVAFLLLSLLLFLSIGIIFGKLVQYKEVQQEDREFHWYQELIRLALGPGKRGQWTWRNQPRSTYLTILGPLFEDLRGPPKYMVSQIERGGSRKQGDRIIASDDETEDAEGSFVQKVFGTLRIYYTLLECVKRVVLGIIAGTYSKLWCSKTPSITLLSITSFQLFFMILKKPFIKKRVQFVEIVSVSSEVAMFALCLILSDHGYSPKDERTLGFSMLVVFLLAFVVQMINEWYALYRQIKRLDPMTNTFFQGLTTALIGSLLLLSPHSFVKNLDSRFPLYNLGETGDTTSSGGRLGSSGSGNSSDKSFMRRIRELTRASFNKEGNKATPNDPSTSKTRLSEFWRSSSSAASTSADFRSKSKGLFKELEDIFASDDQNEASQFRKS